MIKEFYFMLPSLFAILTPPLSKKINFLNYTINERLLGKNKTYRGLIFAVIIGVLIFYIQKILFQYDFFNKISLINYNEYSLLLGFLLAFGAMTGDIVESFFKRRLNILPGGRFIPWDQIDFIIGSLVFAAIIYIPNFTSIIYIFISCVITHIIFNHLGYYLKIKKSKW